MRPRGPRSCSSLALHGRDFAHRRFTRRPRLSGVPPAPGTAPASATLMRLALHAGPPAIAHQAQPGRVGADVRRRCALMLRRFARAASGSVVLRALVVWAFYFTRADNALRPFRMLISRSADRVIVGRTSECGHDFGAPHSGPTRLRPNEDETIERGGH